MFPDSIVIFGATYLYVVVIAIAVVAFLLLPRPAQKQMFVLACIALPAIYLIAIGTAYFYFDPRPFVVGNFTPLVPHAPDNGFPSDHMLLTSAIASILFVYNKKLGVAAWVIAIIVGLSRVYAGIHHLTDIVGSAVIVIASVWILKTYLLPHVAKTKLYKRYVESS